MKKARNNLISIWALMNTPEGLVRCRLIYDIFSLIFWFLYYYIKTKYIYQLTCPPVWTTDYCAAYVSSQTFWINLPFFGALFIDIVVFYYIQKHITKLKTLNWFNYIMRAHVILMIFWVISAASTYLWGLFPFLVIGLVFDLYVMWKIRKLYRNYELLPRTTDEL